MNCLRLWDLVKRSTESQATIPPESGLNVTGRSSSARNGEGCQVGRVPLEESQLDRRRSTGLGPKPVGMYASHPVVEEPTRRRHRLFPSLCRLSLPGEHDHSGEQPNRPANTGLGLLLFHRQTDRVQIQPRRILSSNDSVNSGGAMHLGSLKTKWLVVIEKPILGGK